MIWNFKDFGRSEFVCKHCGQLPEIAEIHYYGMVMYFLQPLRTHIGKPVFIHSGYRCKTHNANSPNTAANSYHTLGIKKTIYHPCAVDFWTDLPLPIVGAYIVEHTDLDFCGYHDYINEAGEWFIHIDWRGYKARW